VAAPVDRTRSAPTTRGQSSPVGLHRVLEPSGDQITLPQTATRLDASPQIWSDEVRIDIEVLNLDAASYRQLCSVHQLPGGGTDGAAVKVEVLDIVATRGKMQNPVTGSGGMLIGTVAEVGPASPLGLAVGDHVATLVSLSGALGRAGGAGARCRSRNPVRQVHRGCPARRP
jgi:L-erythro-3,5-diaminohexanoate dehydrogenase